MGQQHFEFVLKIPFSKYLLWKHGATIMAWHTQNWEPSALFELDEKDSHPIVKFAPNGVLFLHSYYSFAENLYGIKIREIYQKQERRAIAAHFLPINAATFSPEGRHILTASEDGTVRLWNADTGESQYTFASHRKPVLYAEWFPSGDRIVSVDRDRKGLVWNVQTGEIERTFLNLHMPTVLSSDGALLFAGTEVFDTSTGRIVNKLDGEAEDLRCLSISSDGTGVVTTTHYGLTKLWSVTEQILSDPVNDFPIHLN